MTVLTFQPQFVPRVLNRTKHRTMRATRRRRVCIGDRLSLRVWSGRPYMSPQQILFDTDCVHSGRVALHHDRIAIDGEYVVDLEAFAISDGFDTWQQLVAWFADAHGLPFYGDVIAWGPRP